MGTYIEERTSSGIHLVDIETRLFSNSSDIFLTGEINEKSVDTCMKQIIYLVRSKPNTPIKIYINSPGGEVVHGLLLYDLLASIQSTVYIICVGRAYSMAGILLAAGQPGKRFILPNSKVMLHQPYLTSEIGGTSTSVQTIANNISDCTRTIEDILAKHTKKPAKEIAEAIKYDHYFSAQEAVEFGLVDRIISPAQLMKGVFENGI